MVGRIALNYQRQPGVYKIHTDETGRNNHYDYLCVIKNIRNDDLIFLANASFNTINNMQHYIISMIGEGVFAGKSTLGYTTSLNLNNVDAYLARTHKIERRMIVPNKYSYQNGIIWEYTTNMLDVHILIEKVMCFD